MAKLGLKIRELRKSRGLSQAELGGERYSGSYISHIESGRRQPPEDVLAYLAERLGLPLEDFVPATARGSDAELFGLLSAARRLHRVHDWDGAVRLAQEAVQVAVRDARDSRRWEAEFLLADTMKASARYIEAAELAEELAIRPVVAEVPALRVQAHTLAASAYRASGCLNLAVDQGQRAVAFGSVVSNGLESTALVALLSALLTAGRQSETAVHEQRLRNLVDELVDADAVDACWLLGNACFLRGETAEGLQWHARATQLSDPHTDPHAWARLRQATAFYTLTVGQDVAAAQSWYDESSPIITFLGSPGDLADMRLLQGHLLLASGKTDQAGELLHHLTQDAATLGDARLTGDVHQTLGRVREEQGDLASARAAYRTAAESFELAGAPDLAVAAWRRYVAIEPEQ